MATLITYTIECDCEGKYENKVLDLTSDFEQVDELNAKVTIDMTLFGDEVWECSSCGDELYMPSLGDVIQDVED